MGSSGERQVVLLLMSWIWKCIRKIINFFIVLLQILRTRPLINIILFFLTLYTTTTANGFSYGIAVISILFAHEMGHYLACRFYKIKSTLPFFIPIPAPFNPFGTMGAVIKMEGRLPNRKALFDMGVAGPLSGLFVTIIVLIWGFQLPVEASKLDIPLGSSLLFQWLNRLITAGDNLTIYRNAVTFAGWVGLFVTSLNLLPIGQLDGGHIIYAMLGLKSKYIYRTVLILFAVNAAFYPPWVLFLILLTTFGLKHPAPMDDQLEIGWKRRALGIFTFIIFIISFMPFPFNIFQ